MDKSLILKKLLALFHDPPEKPLILGRVDHEERGLSLLGKLIEGVTVTEEIKKSDHIASAADRINFPKDLEVKVDFYREPFFIHPLSGKVLRLPVAGLDYKEVMKLVEEVIDEITQRYPDIEKRYLSLCCELHKILKEKNNGSASLSYLWEILPADTRVPEHSIWEHRRITSTIAGALPEPAMFLLSIGPVQSFIATARKTQDLWAGSYLLSYLAWTGMKVICERFGPDSIIFPDLLDQPFMDKWLKEEKFLYYISEPERDRLSSPTLPNRLFAFVPKSEVKDIAEDVEKKIRETFIEIVYTVKGHIESKVKDRVLGWGDDVWNEIWKRQTGNFMEIYWSALVFKDYKDFLPLYKRLNNINDGWDFEELLKEYEGRGFKPNIGTLYGKGYKLIEKILGSRKILRGFHQQGEPNLKCTLCGEREPVHPGFYKNQNCREELGALKGFWQDIMLQTFPQLRKGERLCAVCVTKRFTGVYFKERLKYNIYDNFPSLSMIASSSFKLRVIENMKYNNLSALVGLYVEAVKKLIGDKAEGNPVPQVVRACRSDIERRFVGLEGEWLYEETFLEMNKKTLWEENKSRFSDKETFDKLFEDAEKKLDKLYNAIKELDREKPYYHQIGKPAKYYAVILMDGDSMGKWLAGEMAPDIEKVLHPAMREGLRDLPEWARLLKMKRPLSPSLHLSMSRALRDFSLTVTREIVERDHTGKLIYSGGDDVLAFASLSDLPEVMHKLRAYFSGAIKIDDRTKRVSVDFENGSGFIPVDKTGRPINVDSARNPHGFLLAMGTNATASMGVVIAHYSENLTQVLTAVREAEKEAKNRKNKDSFCIKLLKRAGGEERLTAKWYYRDDNRVYEIMPLLRDLIDAFQKDYLSPKLAYVFEKESIGLQGLDEKAVGAEFIRIADRQRNKRKDKEFSRGHLEEIINRLMVIFKEEGSVEQIVEFLKIATFLGREENR